MAKRKRKSYPLLLFFALFIWGFSLADMLTPSREYSELENRMLAQAPQFSARALLNNSYTLGFEAYTNDQFTLRDMWISIKSAFETVLLKTENNGIVYGKKGYMFERRISLEEERLERNTQAALDFAKKFKGRSISLMLAPTSDQILNHYVPRDLNNLNQKPLIDAIYARAKAAGVKTVDAWGALESAASRTYGYEDIFYRTDHHWTTRGAWEVYRSYIGTDSFPPSAEQTAGDFYGTYYSKAKNVFTTPDTITYYDIPVKSVTIDGKPVDGLYDLSKLNERDKYAAFLHGNNGVTVIKSGKGNGKKVLLFKDSFGNSFAPFLCYDYDEITVIDLRYFTAVETLLNENAYDDILILYNLPTFAQESSVVNLRL